MKNLIDAGASVKEALRRLNDLSGDAMTLFAVEGDGTVAGAVTDGDIRRALIAGSGLGDRVDRVMHREFFALRPGCDPCAAIAEAHRRRLELLPVVDADNRLTDIIDLRKVKTMIPVDAVLMAGGRGERLRPLTDHTPKPLLPVGGKPIIDYNIEELEACGVKNIFVTVNYLAEQIEEHFRRRENAAGIECVREPRRLGTMGSLSLIDRLSADNVLLMNSDLLTTIDFGAFFRRHMETGADITIAATPYNVSVPYALMTIAGERVTGLEEKPTYNYFANAGVYLIRRALLSRIPRGEYLDAPDFIADVIAEGGNVGYYPIDGRWIDIGAPTDYRIANEIFRDARSK